MATSASLSRNRLSASSFNAPKQAFNNFTYNLNALKKGINGTANDHELGKLNTIGLVLEVLILLYLLCVFSQYHFLSQTVY